MLITTMFHRIKLEFLALFVLVASLVLLLFRIWLDLPFSNILNVSEESHDGTCQCQQRQPEAVSMEWDSSRVLQGSPTERFRGMLSRQYLIVQSIQFLLDNLRNDTQYLTTCAAAGFSMNLFYL